MTTRSISNGVAGLEPKAVWGFFAGIAGVPRPSKREGRIRAHVRSVAEQLGLKVREDATGNLIIDVPASGGQTKAPITVLQAHLDMVCEKNANVRHDFENEGIRLVQDSDPENGERILRADGTTLGADNGIGVALALAAATSPEVVHGPLELLFTIDEEDGMSGAKALTPESFKGRRMLNLDSEEDDCLYIGCAGGTDVNLTWGFTSAPLPSGLEMCQINVTGLRGGHSGVEIHEGRANAIKLLARALSRVAEGQSRLIEIRGGSKRNAIPREASARVAGPAGFRQSLAHAAAEVTREARAESYEPEISIQVSDGTGGTPTAIGASETVQVLSALTALPSGVLGMHPKVAGLVETSSNVSTLATTVQGNQATIVLGMLPRSSSASRLHETIAALTATGRLSGAKHALGNAYPGWSPNPKSPALGVCKTIYQQVFGKEPHVAAIHAGLECGIIGERVGQMDMVSLGPTIRGAHSPSERVYVDSVARTWRFLVALLGAFCKST